MIPQVFLYVTQTCNIRCLMCYSLDTLERSRDLDYGEIVRILEHFRRQGAWKLSLLGGEPTRYRRLPALIAAARSMGYSFVRVVTNGIFNQKLLDDPGMRLLDAIYFSVDGATPEVNDYIRRGGRLSITLRNLDYARSQGYEVRVNTTVNARNLRELFEIIRLAAEHAASEINLIPVLVMGDARQRENELAIDPEAWRATYGEVVRRHREFPIRIKVPPSFARDEELDSHAAAGHRCHAADQDRVYAMANGDVFPCLIMIENPAFRRGIYAGDSVRAVSSEFAPSPELHSYCHFLPQPDGFRPLCIFYKKRLNETPARPAAPEAVDLDGASPGV